MNLQRLIPSKTYKFLVDHYEHGYYIESPPGRIGKMSYIIFEILKSADKIPVAECEFKISANVDIFGRITNAKVDHITS